MEERRGAIDPTTIRVLEQRFASEEEAEIGVEAQAS